MATPESRPVLVVDGDALARAAMSDLLLRASVEPLVVESAERAAEALARRPALAFVDLRLPGKPGDELCRALRLDPVHWDLPVVMLTASDAQADVHRCFLAGADDWATKPLDERLILDKVQAVVGAGPLAGPAPAQGKWILLASDKEFFSLTVGRLLEKAGYHVARCTSVRDAEARLAEAPMAVAIVDLDLFRSEGLLERLRGGTPPPQIVTVAGRPTALPARLAELAPFDVESEVEHLVRRVNRLLAGVTRAERRAAVRIPFHAVLRFRLWGEEAWRSGYSFDLSETGVYVRTLTPLPASKPIEVCFQLEDAGEPLTARGLVVWSNPFGPRSVFSYPYGMGIAFSEFPVAEWTQLRSFIQSKKLPG